MGAHWVSNHSLNISWVLNSVLWGLDDSNFPPADAMGHANEHNGDPFFTRPQMAKFYGEGPSWNDSFLYSCDDLEDSLSRVWCQLMGITGTPSLSMEST
jgi:hypothetical protein